MSNALSVKFSGDLIMIDSTPCKFRKLSLSFSTFLEKNVTNSHPSPKPLNSVFNFFCKVSSHPPFNPRPDGDYDASH